jgi:hypothetical protein
MPRLLIFDAVTFIKLSLKAHLRLSVELLLMVSHLYVIPLSHSPSKSRNSTSSARFLVASGVSPANSFISTAVAYEAAFGRCIDFHMFSFASVISG